MDRKSSQQHQVQNSHDLLMKISRDMQTTQAQKNFEKMHNNFMSQRLSNQKMKQQMKNESKRQNEIRC